MGKRPFLLILSLALGLSVPTRPLLAETCEGQFINTLPAIQPDIIKWMNYVSKDIPKVDQCESVEINNSLNIPDKNISTYGQGATFKSQSEPKKLFVLTAAHVVANSESLEVRCGNKIIKAKIRGISQTDDLAVLELDESPDSIHPLFIWEGKDLPIAEDMHYLETQNKDYLPTGEHLLHTAPEFIAPSDVHIVRDTEKGLEAIPNRYKVKTKLATDPSQHPLIGSKSAIILTSNGVKPGMSGSPLIYSVQMVNPNYTPERPDIEKHFLSGVLVKTYLNETESVVVPIETINSALPFLMNGEDPAKNISSPFYYEKKLSGEIEIPTVTFHTKNGDETFQSVCASPYSDTSGKGGSGDSGGKGGSGDSGGKGGSGDSGGKGGSGDSGGKGGSGDSGGKGGSGDSGKSTLSKDGYYNTGNFSLYRNHIGCKESGIKDSKGNIYLSVIKEDGSVAKAESIEDVSDLIQKYGADFPAYVKEHGLKNKDSDTAYEKFCSDKNLFNDKGQPEKIKLSRKDFEPETPSMASYSSSSEIPNGETFLGSNLEVTCNAQKKSVKIKATRGDFKTDLTITPTTWSGTVNFRGCQSSFENAPKQLWIANHKDNNLDLQMTLSPDKNFLSFNIFAANSNCLTKVNNSSPFKISGKPDLSEVWLSKVDLSLVKIKNPDDDSNKSNELRRKEKILIKADNDLGREADLALQTDRKKVESIIAILEKNELDEIHKERRGEFVSERRLDVLRGQIKYLKMKLDH